MHGTGEKNHELNKEQLHPDGGTGFMPNYLTPGIHLGKAKLENPTEKYATQQMRQSCSNQATEVWC